MKDFAIRAARFAVLALLGIAGALCIAGVLYRPDLRIPAGSAGAHVEVEGVPLGVLQQGAGGDVLLIHGSPGLLEDFDTQAAELESELRVTRHDRPGHGLSGDGGSYSAAYNARVASALIEKLGLERTIVVGHS